MCAAGADFFLFEPRFEFDLQNRYDMTSLAAYLAITFSASWVFAMLASKTHLLNLAQNELQMTLSSIGDGVLVVDRERKVAFLNPIAENLTGWTLAEARGKPVEDVFRIFKQTTREAAFNPIERVISEGKIVGLANHTILIDRQGREYQIEDSAAPIRVHESDSVSGVVLVFRDVTAKHTSELRAQESETQLRLVTSAIPDMIAYIDPSRQYKFVNPAYATMFGLDQLNVIGKKMEDVIGEKAFALAKPRVEAALNGQEVRFNTDIHRENHLAGNFDVIYTPDIDDQKNVCGFVITARDVTHDYNAKIKMTALVEDLERARSEAERANELKSAFLANMSHEIRTPLGAMIGFADLLRDPHLSEADRENYTEILSRNGESLSVIINDILDLSKVEAGQLSLEFADVNPREIVEDVVSLLRVKAREKDLSFELKVAEDSPISIVSDSVRMRQILLNIVGNAIKFTQFGSVKIRNFVCKTESGDNAVCFEIVDSGIGIPESQKEKVFEMFVQADGSMTRRFGGTGLGLALSKKLARALGGDIEITKTEQGKGSTFLITIPDQPHKRNSTIGPQRLKKAEIKINPNALAGLKVLVVDDSMDNRHLIWSYLNKYGAAVDTAENGLIGYRQAIAGTYDIVLMDIQIPEMDGYTATHKLRTAGYRKPIIALTAHAMTDVRQKCLNVGCTSHLPKPIVPAALVAGILEAIASS